MAQKFLLDTNIFLRYLTNDDPRKATQCEKLFSRAAEGEIALVITEMCLAELVWTLDSYYGLDRNEIVEKVVAILNMRGLEIPNIDLWLETITRFKETKVSLIDAYHAAVAQGFGKIIYSYDRDFDLFSDVKRIEPA